jgi:hypothetical protein
LLPDSNVNEVASHGFLRFSIRPKVHLPLPTMLENSAAIYFDFNAPVLTNTIFHTVDTGFLEKNIVAIPLILNNPSQIAIFPNPVHGGQNIFIKNIEECEKSVTIYDARGKQVCQTQILGNRLKIPSNLLNGIYFMEFVYKNGKIGYCKLIIN